MTARKRGDSSTLALPLDSAPAWVIYTLCDPREADPIKRIRYVGVTKQAPARRLYDHIRDGKGDLQTHKARWIRNLLVLGMSPTMETVDVSLVPDREWDRNEVAWISYFRAKGCPLTNGCDGGLGSINPTDEARSRRGEASRVAWSRPGAREKRRAEMNAAWADPERSARMRAAITSPESRAKQSAAQKVAMSDPNVRAKMSATARAAMSPPDVIEKKRAAARAAWADPEKRAAMMAGKSRPDTKSKLSKSVKASWALRRADTTKQIGALGEVET